MPRGVLERTSARQCARAGWALALLGIRALVIIVVLASAVTARQFYEGPFIPLEDRNVIYTLRRAVKFDTRWEEFTPPYSEETLRTLVAAVAHPSPHVRKAALSFLIVAFKQFAIPAPTREQLVPVLTPLASGLLPAQDKVVGEVTLEAQRAVWLLKVQGFTKFEEKREFLRGYLEPGHEKSPHFVFCFTAANDYLVEMASAEAEKVLREALAEWPSASHGRLEVSLKEVDLLRRCAHQPLERQVEILKAVFDVEKSKNDGIGGGVAIWIIKRLGRLNHPAAIQALRDISHDRSEANIQGLFYNDAQRELFRLNALDEPMLAPGWLE
jgi:hypothetical protein